MISLRPKWSLATQILVVLWIACVMMVWYWREPWRLWQADNNIRNRPLPGEQGHISPDRTRMISCDLDSTVKIVEVKEDGELLRVGRLHCVINQSSATRAWFTDTN